MTREKEYDLGELASYHGVSIVATPNTLSGKPRLEGHRIGVNHILSVAERETDDILEAVLQAYPHLETNQVRAALQFAEDHEEIVTRLQHRSEIISKVIDESTKTVQCTCDETFQGVSAWKYHVSTVEPAYKEMQRENREHFIEDNWYGTETIHCTCGETFIDPYEFIGHMSPWYETENHIVEQIETQNS